MRRNLGQLLLLVLIVLVGCKADPAPQAKKILEGEGNARFVSLDDEKKITDVPMTDAVTGGSAGDEVTASLPKQTTDELYEQALLDAIDNLAERKYKEALADLERAQKLKDTGAVQREIYKVQAMLDQESGAERAVQDVKTVLDDGKADVAAKLAGEALSQYGGGDRADELAKLKQEADAVVSASTDDTPARRAALRSEAETAIKGNNLRAAAIALEQAVALGEDAALSKQLAGVREQLTTYDDCRSRAARLRRDPATVDEALTLLRQASEAWPTLLVRQEIDECQLVLERRRDRVGVADLEILGGDIGVPDAGRIVAAELLPHFRPRFDIVERAQVNRVLAELNLDASELGDSETGRRELGRAARVRYLVVGSLSSLGGVTLQARLVEVSTGLVVQTARITAPNVEALLPKLKTAAILLQMDDTQKQAFLAALSREVVEVKKIESAPLVNLPPPPPPPVLAAPRPPAIVTYTPRPAPLGGLVIQDFAALPVVYTPPLPPPPLITVLTAEDPRRHRLFRLSLELGDNCYRRGLYRDAQRHFQLAVSVGGPRRELSLRLDACRPFVAPPPPPPIVVVQQPVIVRPSLFLPPPPPPVVVVRPPVVVIRPRVAVFSWVCNCRPGLVPTAASEVFADQFASYCRGSYEIIDRGEVCWYMGRLGLTMREVLNDPASRRCLAQALNARYFVFGSLRETASFDAETHLVDPESGTRAGTGRIHVKDQDELKLRFGELARQIGAKPEERKEMAAKGVASEKALGEARGLIAKDPAKAAQVARAALKVNPDSVALRTLADDADRRARAAQLEADRRAAATRNAKALEDARKRQEELTRQSAAARVKAEADAAARGEAAKKTQQAQRQRAADALRNQAKLAMGKGNFAQAVQLYQSAANLVPGDAVFQELAAAKVELDKANAARTQAEQKKRDEALQLQRQATVKLAQDEKAKRDKLDADRRKAEEARSAAVYEALMKRANEEMSKKEFAKALATAEAARRHRASPEATKLIADARDQLSLASAKGAAERKIIEEESRKREEADKKVAKDREMYSAAIKRAQDALVGKKYDEAIKGYTDAGKLFNNDSVKTGLKTATDLRAAEQKRIADDAAAKAAASQRAAKLSERLTAGKKFRDAKQYDKAIEEYKEAVKLAPGDVAAVAGLSAAERERTASMAAVNRAQIAKARQDAIDRNLTAGRLALAKKQSGEAEKSAREVLKLDPDNAAAKKLLAEATVKAPPPPPPPPVDTKMKDREDAYLKSVAAARAAAKERKYGEAVKQYDEALKHKPADPVAAKERGVAVREGAYIAHMAQGAAMLKAKKPAEARKSFESALKVKPGDDAAEKGIKDATPPAPPLKGKGKPDKKAQQDKEDYELAMGAGAAAMKKADYKGAINSYAEALRKVPGDKPATAALATARYGEAIGRGAAAAKEKKFGDAVKAYDEALKAKPGDAAAIKGKKEAAAEAAKKK